jgi:ribosomal protein S13
MAKFKHNKKRNSGFLYEVLIQELTKTVLNKDTEAKEKITIVIKEAFSRDSQLYKELKLYHAVSKTKGVGEGTAEKIINEVKIRHREIDKKKLVFEQNKLIRKMRKMFKADIFSNFVPDYKSLASVSQMFNQNTSVKAKVLLENEIIEKMSIKEDLEKMVPIDNLVYKSFVKKFNEQYGSQLAGEQRILLNKFINSFSTNGVELKSYLNEEIGRLKKVLRVAVNTEEINSDPQMLENTKQVISVLESYKSKAPSQQMISEIIKIQELANEVVSNVS